MKEKYNTSSNIKDKGRKQEKQIRTVNREKDFAEGYFKMLPLNCSLP